ncbi:hypothetical protein GCM10010504_37950 [Streptomyces griseus]|nr:hypothetical protein GCM10010504_37950 [Streptomyces griseus]
MGAGQQRRGFGMECHGFLGVLRSGAAEWRFGRGAGRGVRPAGRGTRAWRAPEGYAPQPACCPPIRSPAVFAAQPERR